MCVCVCVCVCVCIYILSSVTVQNVYCFVTMVMVLQEEYQREGIQWKNIEFIDNTGCLEIFSKRPSGLFYLLDEECK